MSMRLQIQIALLALLMAGNAFCDLVPGLDSLGITAFGSQVDALDWCSCKYLAIGGRDATLSNGLVGVYQLNQSTGNLSPVGTPTTFGLTIASIAWCPTCTVLAVGSTDENQAILQLYSFDPNNPGNLQPIGVPTTAGSSRDGFFSLDWCGNCNYLATAFGCLGGMGFACSHPIHSTLQIYGFDSSGNPVLIDGSVTASDANQIKWCPDCDHLIVAGGAESFGAISGFVNVYSFYPSLTPALVLTTSISYNTRLYSSVDVCDNCSYIAAGGQNSDGSGIVDIYSFDAQSTPSLSLATGVTISAPNGSFVNGVAWCQGCDNLAVVVEFNEGRGDTYFIYLYHFDSVIPSLTLVPTNSSLSLSQASSIGWCVGCCDLAVGGVDPFNQVGAVQLFVGNNCYPAPTNLTAQKMCHRFPTQVDIMNTVCWQEAVGAIAYNVYASANAVSALAKRAYCYAQTPGSIYVKTINSEGNTAVSQDVSMPLLLTTITDGSLCYSQHQIPPCKSTTYYVTAVYADGTESVPAVVTI